MSTSTRHHDSGERGSRFASPRAFFGLLITAAAVWFISANNSVVRIHLWLTWVGARLWLVLLLTFVAGGVVGFLMGWRRRRR